MVFFETKPFMKCVKSSLKALTKFTSTLQNNIESFIKQRWVIGLTTPMMGEIWVVFKITKQAWKDFHNNYKQVRGYRIS